MSQQIIDFEQAAKDTFPHTVKRFSKLDGEHDLVRLLHTLYKVRNYVIMAGERATCLKLVDDLDPEVVTELTAEQIRFNTLVFLRGRLDGEGS